MRQKEEFIPLVRTCQRCGKQFQIVSRRQLRKKFCSSYCRVQNSKMHTQAERDRARDMAYAKLTLKDYERDSRMRSLIEDNEKLVVENTHLRELLDELNVVLPRMVETGYMSIHTDSTRADYWTKRFATLQLDWVRLLTPPEALPTTQQGNFDTHTQSMNAISREHDVSITETETGEWDEWNTTLDDGYAII